jgi:uncharacterized protein YbaR (Trm112 family)
MWAVSDMGLASSSLDIYVCPSCKSALKVEEQFLNCPICRFDYPIVDSIPNFVLEDLRQTNTQVFKLVRQYDWLARFYEMRFCYTPVLKIYGGRSAPTFKELIRIMLGAMPSIDGMVLDAACGPGTFLSSNELGLV